MRTLTCLLLLLAACAPEAVRVDRPKCDGALQDGEGDVPDAIYDADGDTWFDASNPDCAATYNLVDCDDANPDIRPDLGEIDCNGVDDDCNPATLDALDADEDGADSCADCDDRDGDRTPGAEEICWDGIDNDCNALPDDTCGQDYNGTWVLDVPVQYSCGVGMVTIDFDGMVSIHQPPYLSMLVTGPGVQPGSLDGELTDDAGGFLLRDWVTTTGAATCDEYYQLTGTFTDPDHFTATFEAAYVGGVACLNCTYYQYWSVNGTRTADATY